MMAIEFQFREVNEANLFRNIYPYGEKSGKMVFSLNQVAEYYEQELSRQIDSLLEFKDCDVKEGIGDYSKWVKKDVIYLDEFGEIDENKK